MVKGGGYLAYYKVKISKRTAWFGVKMVIERNLKRKAVLGRFVCSAISLTTTTL